MSKGENYDPEKYKQPKNGKCGRFMCVSQNCDADVKDLTVKIRIFEDNKDFVVRKRAKMSLNNELKCQGLEKYREI